MNELSREDQRRADDRLSLCVGQTWQTAQGDLLLVVGRCDDTTCPTVVFEGPGNCWLCSVISDDGRVEHCGREFDHAGSELLR